MSTQTMEQRAREFAKDAHRGQKYGENGDYFAKHLCFVNEVLVRFGATAEHILVAGWLHDVLEDVRGITRADLERLFPEPAVAIVDACTDGAGHSRAERKQRSYRLIPETPDAIIVKLADRIANVEACVRYGNDGMLARYRQEHGAFSSKLRAAPAGDPAPAMWKHLDTLLR